MVMWFAFALFSTITWGVADLFYKKGADEADRYSHLKTAMIVGFIMGGHAVGTLVVSGLDYNPANLLIYLPVSLMYILSMTFGYFGLRYLELSISSPVENSSGGICCLMCVFILGQSMEPLTGAGVAVICSGVILLGLFERIKLKKERELLPASDKAADRRYRIGLVAFIMPVLYALIDALGTFFDAYYLDDIETTPLLGVTEETFEDVANVSYELTFLICSIAILVFLLIRQKSRKDVIPLSFKGQKDRILAAVFETAGQSTYVYALSGNGAVAAPMIASYSFVSLILSRIILKEKLTKGQYFAIALVMAGIVILGITTE